MRFKFKISLIAILLLCILFISSMVKPEASKALSLIINGQDVTSQAMPIIDSNRTLVPLRFVSEELGAKVTWNNTDRTVLIEKAGNTVLLKIASRLLSYNGGEDYQLSDVEPKLLNKDEHGNLMTYVPLRLIGNALNIGIEWNEKENAVYIDSGKAIDKESISSIEIISPSKNEKILGEFDIQIDAKKDYKEGSYVQFLLLEKGETSGFIIGKGNNITGKYTYTPKVEDNGQKILVARVFDENGIYLDGDAIPIEINLDPKVYLSGVNNGELIKETASLSANLNFLPLYVKYEIKKISESGENKEILTEIQDPLGSFTWNPGMKDNGVHSIRAIAYDSLNNSYYSEPIMVEVNKERVLTLSGVKEGMVIDKEVNLIANRNFDVSETEYLMRDVNTGIISTIEKIPYGGYKWNPGPDDSGTKDLFVRVIDRGIAYESEPIMVYVNGQAKLSLEGVGPEQVINKAITLNVKSNVDVENIRYFITNTSNNSKRELLGVGANNEVTYNPIESDKGYMIVEAEADYKGKTIYTDKIKFKVYHGEFFGPQPIIEKDKFKDFASNLALNSYKETNMSAALQTAQAILETAWGQSVPVDKYTGTLSKNLFGIKGKGPIGSVTSNTWEVYNGQTYRVDAEFRAYNNVDDSWKEHKTFLLNGERYKPFTEVMFDYTKGAWALKRAGYATDPEYATKLINIIKTYKLYELDKIGI
ncbi:MAG TPA: stalk domain-containing protein [Tissierellaceae bacterium]|nr:stalk domain-containing protein [Tissierellaceae bacterium]